MRHKQHSPAALISEYMQGRKRSAPMIKRLVSTAIVVVLLMTIASTGGADSASALTPDWYWIGSYGANADDIVDTSALIYGWSGPYQEGHNPFATEELSLHGGVWAEDKLDLDGATNENLTRR